MTIDRLINLLAAVTLVEMMVTIGLGVRWADVLFVTKSWGLVGRVLIANYILVPVVAVALLAFFRPEPMIAVGFLIAAACPGAPYGPPFSVIAKGNGTLAVGLMVLLAGSSALLAPLLLGLLVPLIAANSTGEIDVTKIVGTLLGAQLLPLIAGLIIRDRWPNLASFLQSPGRTLSLSLNVLTLGIILSSQWRTLSHIRIKGYLGMLCVLVMSMAAGWIMTTRGENPKAMVLTTSVRNVGVALVIATASFPGTAAVSSVTAYALFQTIVMAFVAFVWGKLTPDAAFVDKRAA
jgi:BASS family bile acid:Na+ symporter